MNKFDKATITACSLYRGFLDFAVRSEMDEEAAALLVSMFEEIQIEAERTMEDRNATNIDSAYKDYVNATITYLREIADGEKLFAPKLRSLLSAKKARNIQTNDN